MWYKSLEATDRKHWLNNDEVIKLLLHLDNYNSFGDLGDVN